MRIGLLAAPVAYYNYKQKQKQYEQALARYNNVLARYGTFEKAVEWYNRQKTILTGMRAGRDEDDNVFQDPPEWLKVRYSVYVGKLLGSRMSMASTLFITNDSDNDVKFGASYITPYLYGTNLLSIADGDISGYGGYATGECIIKAHSTVNWSMLSGFGVKFLTKDLMRRLRKDFMAKCGRSAMNQVPVGTTLDDVLTATIRLERYYQDENGNTYRTQVQWFNHSATVWYKGDTWTPGLWDMIKETIKNVF